MESSWNEMLAEFRKLGGTAENVRLGEGSLGRGLFPIDPAKPVSVRIPESLLLEAKYARIENGTFRVAADAPIGHEEKVFLESYQREYSWGVGHQNVQELLQLIENAPAELRSFLDKPLDLSTWLAGATPSAVAERYLSSRVYSAYKGKRVLMPVVELVNHGPGTQFQDDDGIGFRGQFAGEILVRYGDFDPFDVFETWGFASGNEILAFSLPMKVETPQGPLVINRDPLQSGEGNKRFFPHISMKDGELTLSHMLLGHKVTPSLPRSIFFEIMRDTGRKAPGVTFDMLQHINRSQFYRLLALSEWAEPPLDRLLRDVARYQLEAMSYYIGAAPSN